jgi:phosphohistidine phosphatase
MKRLFIVRHGKSTWDYDSVKDIDRPLKERGISDGYEMAGRLMKKDLKPDLIVSSPGIRALHSAVIFHRVLKLPNLSLQINPEFYLADEDEILSVIYGFDDSIQSVMIFGHNPGFTNLVNYLSNLNVMNVPTTGLAILQFDTDKWNEIGRQKLVKEYFDFPKNT